jgi:hypothetical protein
MDPMTMMLIGSAASSLMGNIIGGLASSSDRKAAEAAMNRAMSAIEAVGAPPDVAQALILKEFKKEGLLTPSVENQVQQVFSKLQDYKEDKTLRDAQVQALQLLQQRGMGGLTEADRAAFNQLRQQVAQEQQSKLAQLQQSMQSRGLAGSGAELAIALQAQQEGTSRLASGSDEIARTASQNALQALAQGSNLSQQMRATDLDVASRIAQAQDEFTKFNLLNQMGIGQRNIERANRAQELQWQRAQNVSDLNVNAYNEELRRQMEAKKWMYEQQLARAQALANASLGQAGQYQSRAQATQQGWSQMGQGLANVGLAGVQYMGNKNKQDSNSLPTYNYTVYNYNTTPQNKYSLGNFSLGNSPLLDPNFDFRK